MQNNFSTSKNAKSTDELCVLDLAGELDELGVQSLTEAVNPLLSNTSLKKLVLNLHDLKFINSKGIGYLVSVHTHMAKDSRSLVLVDANEPVMDVISLVGLTTIIAYFKDLESFFAS